jgi:hypothetical protein
MKYCVIKNPDESPFLGIATGKKKRAEAEADIARIKAETEAELKLEQARRESLMLNLEAAKQGYDPGKVQAEKAIKMEETKTAPEKTLYIILGFSVVVMMAGLYFIKKR